MDAFAAIADPTRRKLLDLLRQGEKSAGELASKFKMSWPAISQHLSVLKGARLVRERRAGRSRLYSMDAGPLAEQCQPWIEDKVAFWNAKLNSLKDYLENTDEETQ